MLTRFIDLSLRNRPLVLILSALAVIAGFLALSRLPIDAVPDVTNVQVQILTKAPALGPVEMEKFITYPIEAAMNGLRNLADVLENMNNEIHVDPEVGKLAQRSINRMLDFAAAKKARIAPGADLAKEAQLFQGIGPA